MGIASLHKSVRTASLQSLWVLHPCTSQWVLHTCTSQWVLHPCTSQWVLHPCTSLWVLHPCSLWVLPGNINGCCIPVQVNGCCLPAVYGCSLETSMGAASLYKSMGAALHGQLCRPVVHGGGGGTQFTPRAGYTVQRLTARSPRRQRLISSAVITTLRNWVEPDVTPQATTTQGDGSALIVLQQWGGGRGLVDTRVVACTQ